MPGETLLGPVTTGVVAGLCAPLVETVVNELDGDTLPAGLLDPEPVGPPVRPAGLVVEEKLLEGAEVGEPCAGALPPDDRTVGDAPPGRPPPVEPVELWPEDVAAGEVTTGLAGVERGGDTPLGPEPVAPDGAEPRDIAFGVVTPALDDAGPPDGRPLWEALCGLDDPGCSVEMPLGAVATGLDGPVAAPPDDRLLCDPPAPLEGAVALAGRLPALPPDGAPALPPEWAPALPPDEAPALPPH